ncbi:PspA/IM30 family protein (plasmid) [Shinella yambaruensis]|uniref:PspA/IM30 family protein n=1 Tax=Shinella TaxID=323620 RepID=UPI00225CEB9D|nr:MULTISPECIES: PspA/IM30 family protein [unclassified Shinella]MCW5710758.1 PspA/IM30 family protein [Shinella sp.]MDC7259327.1 PspA/IM30 family protein [Shinella sp. YE25]CAI0336117.1 Phage shock protein A PspA family protein [Rhizobiaceae bacterium]CAK7261506.1 Phage shock protein A PspA family protein [Shinella sp. WSC3-e]
MFKQILTLVRGRAHEAEEAFGDRHALPVLAQQIRDAARGVEAARRAVAVAIAQNRLEAENAERLAARIKDLEARAIAALEKGREDLAIEAAGSIARLETELQNARQVEAEFSGGIDRLRQAVRQSEMRLSALRRGERLALARDRTRRLAHDAPGENTLADAEATLARLERRQREAELTAEALGTLETGPDPAALAEKLAAAGCGRPLVTSADEVLQRLRSRMNAH